MRTCTKCGAEYPEVAGVDTQQCPHCGLETPTRARPALQAARADPAGAAALGLHLSRRHYGALLLLWIPALLVDVAGSLALVAYQAAADIPENLYALSIGEQMRFLGVALPVFVVIIGAKLAAMAVSSALVADALAPEGGNRSLLSMRGRSGGAMALGVALALAYLAGLVLLIVPFVIFFHWWLFAPAAYVERKGIGAALDASRRFARERKTFGFTALLLIVLAGLYIASSLASVVVLVSFEAAGVSSGYVNALVATLTTWLASPFFATLPAAYYFAAAKAPQQSPIDPSAPPADRFRTTKCPGCGTLVPYTATGQPVDVVCPVCGRAGKVL